MLIAVAALVATALGQEGAAPETAAPETTAPDTAAETTENRIITIDGSGGTQRGNLRYGPIIYEHPEPTGITATVSTLTILGSYVELTAPEGVSIATGGERKASFRNGVVVQRGRLEATGPTLEYDEATGLGVLSEDVEIEVAPEEEGDEPVLITANAVSFDVDTDRSTSTGDVELVNGNQTASAQTLIFEEENDLGVLSNEGGQTTITRVDDNGEQMTITADEIRVLTTENLLYAVGNVTVVDGPITSTGAVVYFDDASGIAEVIGSAEQPAEAVDADSGASLVTDRIKQDIEFDFFEAIDASVPSDFDPATFALKDEATE
ncbi:MAG TPA: LptA/OstA family protein [Trueperaceae bacterium]|nr:LptA/OstA family protein [Trueperaceae bacterium]